MFNERKICPVCGSENVGLYNSRKTTYQKKNKNRELRYLCFLQQGGDKACAYIEKKAAIKRVQSDARHFLQRLTHHTHTIVEQ